MAEYAVAFAEEIFADAAYVYAGGTTGKESMNIEGVSD